MTFQDAVRTCFEKSVTWRGRAGRSEFWYFALSYIAALFAASLLDQVWGTPVLSTIVLLGFLLPAAAVTIRRLHDTGKSGWWYWMSLIPFAGGIIMIVLMALDGNRGANRYGPPPVASTSLGTAAAATETA